MSWLWDWIRNRTAFAAITGHPADRLEAPGLQVDAEGWLVDESARLRRQTGREALVHLVPSVRHSPQSTRSGPIAIVWHYTATDYGTAAALAKRIQKYKRGVDRAASWHVCIGRDGTIYQSVSFLRGSWHCAKGTIAGHRVNACSVGVELEGHGKTFSEKQIEAAELLVRALRETYPIESVQADRGHREFDPARRSDPGPVWEELLPDLIRRAYRPA